MLIVPNTIFKIKQSKTEKILPKTYHNLIEQNDTIYCLNLLTLNWYFYKNIRYNKDLTLFFFLIQ